MAAIRAPHSSAHSVGDSWRRKTYVSAKAEHVSLRLDCSTRADQLRERVKRSLRRSTPDSALQLIDTLERLGIAYHFEEEIDGRLQESVHNNHEDIFFTSLRFRLLRQQGFDVSPYVFLKFLDTKGNFNDALSENSWGMLSLYEASHLGADGEDILSRAMEVSTEHLKTLDAVSGPAERLLRREIAEALKVPRHMRMVRLDARRCIEQWREESFKYLELRELAALDFNTVQSLHQKEAESMIRWWEELDLARKLSFARDRPLESYAWALGIFWEPCYLNCRTHLAKTIAVLHVIDDIFDRQGSMDELVRFTSAIHRWDLASMPELPEYMKICYMALYNNTNEIASIVLKEHGWNITDRLRRTWADLCEAYLVEARWFSDGKVPPLEDYLRNGVTTGGTYMALLHAFFLIGEKITDETVGFLEPYPKLFTCAGRILRLWDDLGTSKEEVQRGDTASCLECLKRRHGVKAREEDARKHVRKLIQVGWKELNKEFYSPSPLPLSVTRACLNVARTAQVVYESGDDDRCPSVDDLLSSLLVNPIDHGSFSSPQIKLQ
ncbi:monoterpene synthase TPS4, chloroplastic-like [Aristolochia californica]|uniref:monoterpene synthase TPS4, chloroplastic-like n=1 Tax=Aristolochia californica TaxID=171875 RepID=UPI0035DE9E8B